MHYAESAAQSAEILRLVLPRIASSGGNYVPTSYAVWYEHLAGLNPGLTGALESELARREVLDLPALEQLYSEHIREREVRSNLQLQEGLGQLLRKLVTIATTSGSENAEYSKALQACEQELGSIDSTDGLKRVLGTLVGSTASARAATETLRSELETTQTEIQSLRDRLGTLQGEALTDPLTGLRNRRGFEEAHTRLTNESPQALDCAAVLLADIDHFKKVNDTYGHLFGDQVIRAAAKVLSDAIKGRDIVARFGGEEFVMLLPDTPAQGAMAVAEQIRLAFSKARIRRNGSEQVLNHVTISIGAAMPGPGETLEQVIDRADKALYQAKNEGRNCVRMSTPGKAQRLKVV
jgi:diguanylate cyclase